MRVGATEHLYIRSMGKALRVVAVAATDDEANADMERHPTWAVVACFPGRIYLADRYDPGVRIAD